MINMETNPTLTKSDRTKQWYNVGPKKNMAEIFNTDDQ